VVGAVDDFAYGERARTVCLLAGWAAGAGCREDVVFVRVCVRVVSELQVSVALLRRGTEAASASASLREREELFACGLGSSTRNYQSK
jgi:hypothetical protein